MKNLKKIFAVTLLALLAAPAAYAACGINKGSIRILSNDFGPLHSIANKASECASASVEFTKNLTKEHKNLQVAALKSNPAQYTVAVIATSSIVPLINDDLIRPLDDLVAKYGKDIGKNQLIKNNGKIMAVSVFVNSQHLVYRKDI